VCNDLTGVLPAEWGNPSAFQRLERLYINNCSSIAGVCCTLLKLASVMLDDNHVTRYGVERFKEV